MLRILKKETSCLFLHEAIDTAQDGLRILLQEKEELTMSEEERLLSMDKDSLARVTFMEEFLDSLVVTIYDCAHLRMIFTYLQKISTLTPAPGNPNDQICAIPLSDLNHCVSVVSFSKRLS